MPYRSRAQQRFFNAAASRGEIPKAVADEWNQATKKAPGGYRALPNKVRKKRRKKMAASQPAQIAETVLLKMAAEGPLGGPQLPSLANSVTGASGAAPSVARALPQPASMFPAQPPAAAPGAAPGAPAGAPAGPTPPPVGWDMSKSHWMRPVGT